MQAIQNSTPFQGFITASAWAERNGLQPSQVKYLCATGRLEYKVYKGKRYINESSDPKIGQNSTDWITIPAFAALHNMSISWARRIVNLSKVKTRKQGGHVLIAADSKLTRQEKTLRSGKQFVFFKIEQMEAGNA